MKSHELKEWAHLPDISVLIQVSLKTVQQLNVKNKTTSYNLTRGLNFTADINKSYTTEHATVWLGEGRVRNTICQQIYTPNCSRR